MKTIKVTVKKETIQKSNYEDNENCAICKTLRMLGYEIKSAGGEWVRGFNGEMYRFLNGTGFELANAFTKKRLNEPYGDVVCELQEPPKAPQHPAPKAPEVVERIVYVMVDSTGKRTFRTTNQ